MGQMRAGDADPSGDKSVRGGDRARLARACAVARGPGDGRMAGDPMAEYPLSRREFLALVSLGAASLGSATALGGCAATSIPKTSPFVVGPYKTGLAILGETAGTTGLAQPFKPEELSFQSALCRDGQLDLADPPTQVLAAV